MAGLAPLGPYVGASILLYMLSPGPRTPRMASALSYLAQGWDGWNFRDWPGILSVNCSLRVVSFGSCLPPEQASQERGSVGVSSLWGSGPGRWYVMLFYVLSISCHTVCSHHAERAWTLLVKGSKVKRTFSLLSLIWPKMCRKVIRVPGEERENVAEAAFGRVMLGKSPWVDKRH